MKTRPHVRPQGITRRFGIDASFIRQLSRRLALAVLAAVGIVQARAADRYWDATGNGDGAVGGAGTWDTTSLFWDLTGLDPAGPANVVWNNAANDVAHF